MIKNILISIIMLIQFGYAEDKGEQKMIDPLMDKPFYMVKIDAVNTNIVVTLNGEEVFSDFTKSQKLLEVPVNQYMTSGENILKVYLMLWESDTKNSIKNAEAKISLRVKKFEVFDVEPITVSQIIYVKGNMEKSTLDGTYNSSKNFVLDKEGNVLISKVDKELLPKTWTGDKIKGFELEQTITLDTPFPRWKFLDSENIIDSNGYYVDFTTYKSLRKTKDMEGLFTLHQEIYHALKNKNIPFVVDLFTERNKELEIALYKPEGYYKKLLTKRFTDNVNDSSLEMFPFLKDKRYFFISEGGKTLSIRNAVVFNDKNGNGSTSYKILFRKEKGKWILTR